MDVQRELCKEMIEQVMDRLTQQGKTSRPRSLALTKLEEAKMWLEKEQD